MRKELEDAQMDNVVGGTVIISKNYMNVGFSTLGEKYNLKNVTYEQARDYRDKLIKENPQMNNATFDKFCKQQFHDRGWI